MKSQGCFEKPFLKNYRINNIRRWVCKRMSRIGRNIQKKCEDFEDELKHSFNVFP